jgi:glyoxylase I family protein
MKGRNTAIGGGGFHHVAIRVKDFDTSLAFYTQALGFKPAMAWGEGDKRAVMLDTGDGSCLEIFAGGDGSPAHGGLLHYALKTADCDAAFRRARDGGAVVMKEPFDVDIPTHPAPTPVRIAFVKGPDGEEIEFFQNR